MPYTYAKLHPPQEVEYDDSDEDFICYPEKCVFCDSNSMSELSDDGNRTQTCGECKKTFYAPDYYEIKDRKLVRKA